ncbi:MAG: ABC transporter ATP-binding protein [Hyphomicrobiales bacterium]|jgi:branched-chain amino acid transport system ATP-binding protein|nr:ABC transporter ATP-binding protein [Hyphomicrobiales bacterium]
MSAILDIRTVVKRFGGLIATDHLSLDVQPGELHALIGPNGAGKTTIINQLMGEIIPDSGEIIFGGQTMAGLKPAARVRKGLGRTFQITQLLPDYTALAHVALAVQAHAGHSFHFFGAARADRRLTEPAMALLERTGLAPRAGVKAASLSHGERKQLELAIALAGKPKLLLLDEPMAGLGQVETAQMVDLLNGLKGQIAMLLVEHDMDAVFALADRISVLVYGRCIASGSAAEIQANPDVKTAYLGEGDA